MDSAFEFWHWCSLSQAGALPNSQPPTPDTGSLLVVNIKLFEDVIVPEMTKTNQNRPLRASVKAQIRQFTGMARLSPTRRVNSILGSERAAVVSHADLAPRARYRYPWRAAFLRGILIIGTLNAFADNETTVGVLPY